MTENALYNTQTIEQSDGSDSPIGEILNLLWLKKRLIIILTLIIATLGITYIHQLVPRYTATTELLIEDKQPKIRDIDSSFYTTSSDAKIIGIMEVLKSRDLAKLVIGSLQLDKVPEFNGALKPPGFFDQFHLMNDLVSLIKGMLGIEIQKKTIPVEQHREAQIEGIINTFLSKVQITQLRFSNVLNVTYESEDPVLAARIANEIVDKYSIGQLEAKFQATKKATDWLHEKLEDLKKNVDASEHAVENYRQQKGLALGSNNVGLTEQQLSELNSQLIAARAEAEAAKIKSDKYKLALSKSEGGSDISETLQSPMIIGLKQEESRLQGKFSDLSAKLTLSHPSVIQAQAELQQITDKIKAEIGNFASASQSELELTQARVNAISASVEEYKSKTAQNRQEEVSLRALKREAEANKTLYETFLARFKEASSTQGIQESDVQVISKAVAPGGASYPNTRMLTFATVSAGLLSSLGLVFLLEILNPGLRSPEQVEQTLKVHTLGIVPISESSMLPYDYILEKPRSISGEAINSIRVSLSLLNPDDQVKSVLITSSLPSEGKSTLSLMLARMSALAGQKVLLIDADLRRPAIYKMLKISTKQLGLTDLLLQPELTNNDVMVSDALSSLQIIPRGKTNFVNPADLFASQRMKSILSGFEKQFDLVIIDSPPVMAVTDAKILTGLVDKTIFVLKWDDTPKKVAQASLKQLSRNHTNAIAGVVLQQVNMKQYSRYSNSGYYYAYGKYKKYYTS